MLCLNPCSSGRWSRRKNSSLDEGDIVVLILVLVEDGLGDGSHNVVRYDESCLNPCSSGRWSRSYGKTVYVRWKDYGLNPCSSGRWSRSNMDMYPETSFRGLNPCSSGRWSRRPARRCLTQTVGAVLILVLVEDGLGEGCLCHVLSD